MSQSKTQSLYEAISNIVTGYITAVIIQMVVFPWFGIKLPFFDGLLIATIFTVVSLVRCYIIRRIFNKKSRFVIRRVRG